MNYNRSLALLGALALGVQLTFAWTQFGLSADNLRQLGAAQNWVDGYGVVVRHFDQQICSKHLSKCDSKTRCRRAEYSLRCRATWKRFA